MISFVPLQVHHLAEQENSPLLPCLSDYIYFPSQLLYLRLSEDFPDPVNSAQFILPELLNMVF